MKTVKSEGARPPCGSAADAAFSDERASNFREAVLSGCELLSYDELRDLADELHERARRKRRLEACGRPAARGRPPVGLCACAPLK